MENNIKKIIEHGNSIHQKHEQIRQEILADEILLPKELRDGLHLQPNLMDENFPINMVFEVKNKKVIKVYKNESNRTN